jgi:hypothetical protein
MKVRVVRRVWRLLLLLLLLLLFTEVESSPSGSSPYTSTDETNKKNIRRRTLQQAQ